MADGLDMVRAWQPGSEAELAVMQSLLEAHGVPCYVQGGVTINRYGSMMIAHPVFGKSIWVRERDVRVVDDLAAGFLGGHASDADPVAEAWNDSPLRRLGRFLGLYLL